MTETNVPRLRFRGFDEEWSEKKLNEVADRVTRKNKNLDSDLPLTISAQYGLVDQETFFNKKVASKDLSNYILVKRGEFAYNKSYSNGYPFGTIKSLKRYDMGVLSSLYIVFAIKENISHLFMDSFFDSNHWHKEVSTKTTEGARNHGLLNISPQDFMKSKIFVPNNIEEQNRIGLFISNLDNLIELQTKKLEQLKKLKQGYLQKMFPQDGESVPRLRFSEFSGDWKTSIISEYFKYFNGGSLEKNISDHGKYNVINLNSISINGTLQNNGKYVSEDIDTLNEDDLIMILSDIAHGNLIGITAVIDHDDKYVLNQRVGLLRLKNFDNSAEYFHAYINRKRQYFKRVAAGTSQLNLSKKDIMNCMLLVPCIKEQNKISRLLSKLDQMINDQSDKIENLKRQKRAYLQKMFI